MHASKATMDDEMPAVRQAVYRFLRAALGTPTAEQHDWMCGPDFARSLEQLTTAFGVDHADGKLVPEDFADHESRYLACFEVGMPGPPVPLLASHYQKREPAPRVIHEHILFYRRFGSPGPDRGQAPADHLVYQLNFLIHLDQLFRAGRADLESVLWARQDFLYRHVRRWVAAAHAMAEENGLPAVYKNLLAILAAAIDEDFEWTVAHRAEPTREAP